MGLFLSTLGLYFQTDNPQIMLCITHIKRVMILWNVR